MEDQCLSGDIRKKHRKTTERTLLEIVTIRSIFLSLTFALIFVQTAIGEEKVPSRPFHLRVVSLPHLSFAPFYIAEEEGFFKEQGLQVEFVKMDTAVQAIPALIRGDLHVMAETIFPNYLNAISRGAKLRIVADKGHLSSTGCTYAAIVARRLLVEEGKLSTLSQLKGRRVAAGQASAIPMYYLEKLLSQVGLTTADMETVILPALSRFEAMERGAVDIMNATEPWLTQMQQAGYAVIWKPVQEFIPNFQHAVLLFGPTLLAERADIGKRFMVAYLKAVRQFNLGKTGRNLEIVSKHTGLDHGILKKCCWPAFQPNGQINVQSLVNYQSWAIRKGFLDREVPPDQFWDPSFVEYATRVLK